MPTVRLGNSAPAHPGVSGNKVTTAEMPGNLTIPEALRSLFHADGLWRSHSESPTPDWVEVDGDPLLAEAISEASGCPIGRPAGWDE